MRLFIALNPSAEERARLAAASSDLREAGFPVRWLPADNVHLTLKFLGEVPEEGARAVSAAVDGGIGGIDPFDMQVGGFGAFPSARRPSVVWAGIAPSEALSELQGKVEKALEALGFPREDRPFKPHLTIGRSQKRARPSEFRGLEEALAGIRYEDSFRVGSVEVMWSRLMPSGAIYEVIHRSQLGR
jgi:2'-5' RNA ligase